MTWGTAVASLGIVFVTSACSTTQIVLPSSCLDKDITCERNINAQTLSAIGQEEAAIQLMCTDPAVRDVMGQQCLSTE
jgi:hypothetical protein